MSYQKRAHLRIPTDFDAVIVASDSQASPAKINNLSVSGLQILTKTSFQKEALLLVQFFIPLKKEYFELTVKVLRTKDVPKTQSGFVCVLGVQIIDPPETWIRCAKYWIESRFEKVSQRRITAGLLWVLAFAFAFKAALTTLGLQSHELSLKDFTGLENLDLPALGNIYILSSLFLTSAMLCCGLQILRPAIRSVFFFSSSAAFAGVACFSIRILFKFSLLQEAADQNLIYFIDIGILLIGLVGAFMSRQLEDRYKHFKFIVERERIDLLSSETSQAS